MPDSDGTTGRKTRTPGPDAPGSTAGPVPLVSSVLLEQVYVGHRCRVFTAVGDHIGFLNGISYTLDGSAGKGRPELMYFAGGVAIPWHAVQHLERAD